MVDECSPRRLRVAFVTQTFYPVVGGSERQLLALLPRLQARGIVPLVVTRRVPGAPMVEQLDGVEIRRLGSVGHGPVGSAAFLAFSLKVLHRHAPDVVHAFSLMTPATIGALHRARTRTPLLVKILRGGSEGDHDRIRDKPLYALRRATLVRSIDAVQVISDEIDGELERFGVPEERRLRIPNGVDLQRIGPSSDKAALRPFPSVGVNDPVFVYVGRLVPEKRLDLLLDAFHQLAERRPDAHLLIVGDGPERDRVEAAALGDRRIIAFGATEDVAPLLAASSVYVHASATEGMSNSLLEAMAAALPIVATDVGAARELLGDGERGWVVPPGAPVALCHAMLAALDETEGRRRARLARSHVETHHSLDGTADALVEAYHQLAAARSTRRSSGAGDPA